MNKIFWAIVAVDAALFLILLIVGTISVSISGFLGGKLVFDYGTGVNASVKSQTADQQIDIEGD